MFETLKRTMRKLGNSKINNYLFKKNEVIMVRNILLQNETLALTRKMN